jgi:hypothetical protein
MSYRDLPNAHPPEKPKLTTRRPALKTALSKPQFGEKDRIGPHLTICLGVCASLTFPSVLFSFVLRQCEDEELVVLELLALVLLSTRSAAQTSSMSTSSSWHSLLALSLLLGFIY